MTITSMMMEINNTAQESPIENPWEGLAILMVGIPLLSCTVSFIAIYKLTKSITRSVIGTIIGFAGAFIGTAIPINSEVTVMSIINFWGAYAGILYFVVMTTFIGLIVAPSKYIK